MVYFKEVQSNQPALVRYEEGKLCEKYNYKKGRWEKDYKIFADMLVGKIEVDKVTEQEVNKLINEY